MVEAEAHPLRSKSATTVRDALKPANEIGYPVIVRVAYTLGGRRLRCSSHSWELREIVTTALAQSRIAQVLVEEYVGHWKEIEYEVVRDYADNCLTVCNMENFDPMGVHTGDSIVVAPSQTLTNREYHLIRSTSINTIRAVGHRRRMQHSVGVASEDGRVPRHRSQHPHVPKLRVGKQSDRLPTGIHRHEALHRLPSPRTHQQSHRSHNRVFRAALDYVTVKIPRWDLQKFKNADRHVGPQMRSVGEVMSIGRCLEEALQKAVRMLDIGKWAWSATRTRMSRNR